MSVIPLCTRHLIILTSCPFIFSSYHGHRLNSLFTRWPVRPNLILLRRMRYFIVEIILQIWTGREESQGPIEKVITSSIFFWIHFFALFFFFTFSTINFLVYLASFCHLLFVLLCPDLLSILFLINRHISQFRLFEFRTSSYLFFFWYLLFKII